MGALSKGCGSCKRRKVKCDETRPNCTRCRNAGIECAGFARRLRFVDEKPRIRRSIAVSWVQSHEFSTIARSSNLEFHSSRINRPQSLSPATFLANTLPLTAFEDDIFTSYLLSRLFEGKYRCPSGATEETQCGLPADWVPELVNTPQKPRHKSWDALAAIVFGQAHNNDDVITNALRLYGQALSELRSQLSNPDNQHTDSTLASITALYMYEILGSKTEKGWMPHANGLGRLLEWRGPWQQKSYAGKSIFLEHRIMLVAKSIVLRQSTFLRDPIWKLVPWEDDPTSKSAIDYLIDIGTDAAECLAQIKTYDSSKSMQEIENSKLRAQAAMCLEELNAWWRQREEEHAQIVTVVASPQVTGDLLFPTLLEYDMLWTAFSICTYDAIRILLLQLWNTLQLFPSSIQTTDQRVVLDMPNRTALLGITSDTKGLACEILRSLTYCYGKSGRFISTFSFLFIQDVAYGCFDQDSKEAKWVVEHRWAELANFNDIKDTNLLRRLLPSGQIKVGAWLGTSDRAPRV